ncbi:MAG: hypothetical protein K5686_09810 [Lachnospiraceae bacterium]|nr:hypothetical protein [Lachnospiraceae bacterium]
MSGFLASNFTPPLRSFIADNEAKLKGKRFAAFACQSGAGADKAFEKLAKCLKIDGFEKRAVFIDPKDRPSKEKDAQIDEFAASLEKIG